MRGSSYAKEVQIVSDGSLDLPQEITDAHDIEVVPFYVSFNGETYQKEIEEIGIREFYQEMVDTRMYFQNHLCRQWMILSDICKKCKGKYSSDLHLYYDKIQWLPAICNGCKRDGKGRISRGQDHSY